MRICCLWCCMLWLVYVVLFWFCLNAQQTTRDHGFEFFSREWLFYLASVSYRCVHTKTVHIFEDSFYTILYTTLSLMLIYWKNKSNVRANTTIKSTAVYPLHKVLNTSMFWIKKVNYAWFWDAYKVVCCIRLRQTKIKL